MRGFTAAFFSDRHRRPLRTLKPSAPDSRPYLHGSYSLEG